MIPRINNRRSACSQCICLSDLWKGSSHSYERSINYKPLQSNYHGPSGQPDLISLVRYRVKGRKRMNNHVHGTMQGDIVDVASEIKREIIMNINMAMMGRAGRIHLLTCLIVLSLSWIQSITGKILRLVFEYYWLIYHLFFFHFHECYYLIYWVKCGRMYISKIFI